MLLLPVCGCFSREYAESIMGKPVQVSRESMSVSSVSQGFRFQGLATFLCYMGFRRTDLVNLRAQHEPFAFTVVCPVLDLKLAPLNMEPSCPCGLLKSLVDNVTRAAFAVADQ